MAILFDKSRATINEHILNIFKENELEKESVMRKIGISDFSTKPTNFPNTVEGQTILDNGIKKPLEKAVLNIIIHHGEVVF